MTVAGFFSGVIMPSRDMIVREITPPGSFGKVFGFVTTGFNIGGIVSPLIFGAIMDHGSPRLVFLARGGLQPDRGASRWRRGRAGRAEPGGCQDLSNQPNCPMSGAFGAPAAGLFGCNRADLVGGSFNGRTSNSDSGYLGSNPSPPANSLFH